MTKVRHSRHSSPNIRETVRDENLSKGQLELTRVLDLWSSAFCQDGFVELLQSHISEPRGIVIMCKDGLRDPAQGKGEEGGEIQGRLSGRQVCCTKGIEQPLPVRHPWP